MVSTTVLAKLNVETTDCNDKLSISGGKMSQRFLRRKKNETPKSLTRSSEINMIFSHKSSLEKY